MRFLEESSEDESLCASGAQRVVTQKSAMHRRRIIESDSDSDSESEGGSDGDNGSCGDGGTVVLAESPLSEQEGVLSVEVNLGNLSISNAALSNNGLIAEASDSQCSCSSASVLSRSDAEDRSGGSSSYATCHQSVVRLEDDQEDTLEDTSRESLQSMEMAQSPAVSMTSASVDNHRQPRDSAWTLDETSGEYSLTGKVDAIKGEVCWPELRVPQELYDRLYDHQKVGVQWMASLHNDGIGGILGDDMGLGKTYQTLTFLGGLMMSQTIRNALVLCPVSLLRTWENEARSILNDSFELDVSIHVISSDVPKRRRSELLRTAMNCSSECPFLTITTYGLVTSNPLAFVHMEEDGEKKTAWNYVVLDEGHKIKNPSTKTTKSCHRICKNEKIRRLLLTGTPIQNNLKELWTLFDFATSSKLLGTSTSFNNRFAQPIEAGRHKNASDSTVAIAAKANEELQSLLRPHFLQRLKSVEFKDELPSKREIVVWTHLSEKQRQLYEDYVENGGNVRSILAGEISSPLEAISWLKKLCGHPLLVSWSKTDWDMLQFDDDGVDHKTLVRDSAKLKVLIDLLTRLRKSGHRTLVFSQSTKMLNIIEKVCRNSLSLARIDGSTKERERQRIVNNFNKQGSRCDVMLLSTKAAGLGLTLTGADRCVVYDPSWNPAEDSQAVDRCFRIGQSKKVTVYRFIAAGTVEERMYEKQVFKLGINRAIMTSNGSSTKRYFDKDELRRLFHLSPEGCCEILEKFRGEKTGDRGYDEDEDGNESQNASLVLGASGKRSFLDSHRHVVGLSAHDHLYTDVKGERSGSENMPESQSTPFAGTPLKERRLGRAARALQAGKRLKFGPVGSKDPETLSRISARQEKQESQALDTLVERKPLAAITSKDNTFKCSEHGYYINEQQTKALLEDCTMKEQEITMGLMLNDLDSDLVKGQEKLKLHENIVRLAIQLGWL